MAGDNTIICTDNFTFNISTETKASAMQYNDLDKILISVLFPCILLLGLTTNIAFLFVLVRVPWMKTSTNVFLASIAVADTVFSPGWHRRETPALSCFASCWRSIHFDVICWMCTSILHHRYNIFLLQSFWWLVSHTRDTLLYVNQLSID